LTRGTLPKLVLFGANSAEDKPQIVSTTQLKKQQVDALEQDIELCPLCCFPVTKHTAA